MAKKIIYFFIFKFLCYSLIVIGEIRRILAKNNERLKTIDKAANDIFNVIVNSSFKPINAQKLLFEQNGLKKGNYFNK